MHIDHSDGYAVARQLASTQQAMDAAIIAVSRLISSGFEIGMNAALAPATTQPALQALAASLRLQVEARGELISAWKQLAAIKKLSNLRDVDFGCLGDGSIVEDGGLRIVASVE